jgi:hypothetical protein
MEQILLYLNYLNQKVVYMKKWFYIFCFLFSAIFLQSISIEKYNDTILITGDFTIEKSQTISYEDSYFTQLSITGCQSSGTAGEAELPAYSQFIHLPATGNYRIVSFTYEHVEIALPYPLAAWGKEDKLELNNDWRTENKWLPEKNIYVSEPVIMRGIRFTQFTIHPVHYNPSIQTIRVMKHVRLELKLDESIKINELNTNRNTTTKAFSEVAAATIFGYEPPRIINDSSYLIIIPDNCEAEIGALVKWKQKLGYPTSYVKLSQIGTTNEAIKSYLQNAYDTWENPPEYVILVGDVTGSFIMPSNYVDAYYPPGTTDVSDHTYTLLQGDDYFPDVFIGRISVQTTAELQTIIHKIIYYESNPYTGLNWFEKALMVTYVSLDWGNYTSSRETKMAIRDKLFNYTYAVVDTFFSPYQSSAAQLQNKINQGYSFINYRGFGGPNYWWEPFFTSDHVLNLNNGYLLPMVTSMTCGGGDFAASEYVSCFGETWLKAGTPSNFKGAIGFIGPSERDTKTPFNNSNDMGIYQGITQENLLRCGQMLLRGKMELYNNYPTLHGWGGSLNSVQFYFYVYNLLGDPGLRIWNESPDIISFTMTENITTTHNFIEIQIPDSFLEKEHFIVAITADSELLYRSETNETGSAIIPVQFSAGSYQITLSKDGYIPLSSSFEVISQNILTIVSHSTDIEPISGATLQLTVQCQNQSNIDFAEANFTLSTSSTVVTMIENQQIIESFLPMDIINLTFLFALDSIWLEENLINFFLTMETEETTHTLHLPITTSAPEIMIQQVLLDNQYLLQGSSNQLWLSLQNTGSVETGETLVELCSENENQAVISECFATFNTLLAGQIWQQENPYMIEVNENVITGETLYFYLLFKQNEVVLATLPFSLVAGFVDTTSPTFSEYGYMAIESRDAGNFLPVSFSWIEIDPQYGGNGTLLAANHTTADGYSSIVNLPFLFTYFGIAYDKMAVCSEGYISMGGLDLVFHRNRNIPSGSGPKAMIAPFWDNLTQGNIFFQYMPNQNICIIQWSKMRNAYYPSCFETFQVILYNPVHYPTITGDGMIKFQYMEINNVDSADNFATVGIENETKTSGLLLTFANIYPETVHTLQNQTAVLFTTGNNTFVENSEDVIVSGLQLWQNHPNPFNPVTTISFSLESELEVSLSIYNIKGQKIRTVLREKKAAGIHYLQWDGTNDKKQQVSSGIYFYRLKTPVHTLTKRMLLLK